MELFTIKGKVTGVGVFTLESPLVYGQFQYVRIPKGLKAKVWCKRIASSEAADVALEYTRDVTAGTPTWIQVDVEKLAAAGEVSLEKRRPVILYGFTGKEAFRFNRIGTGTADCYIDVEVEISE